MLHTPNFVFYILVVGCLYFTNFTGTLLCGLYCRRVLACPSVRPSVCRLVKTAERIVEFLLLPGNPVIVVSFRTIPLAGIPVGIIHHHQQHGPSWNTAVSTTCFQCSRSWVHYHAELRPRLRGWRSASRVRSQVWRGRPGGHLQSCRYYCRWIWKYGHELVVADALVQLVCDIIVPPELSLEGVGNATLRSSL